MTVLGFLWQLAWSNPYTDPPDGQPRLLAEIYLPCERPGEGARPAPEMIALHRIGSGYSIYCQAVHPAPKQLPPESLAGVRQKRLARRMQQQAPLLADELIADELAAKPDYYAGITDPALQAAHDKVIAAEDERRQRLTANPGKLFVYAELP